MSALAPRIARTVTKPKRDPVDGNSKSYLAWLRQFPCVACLSKADHVHHLLKTETGHKGHGRKNLDRWGLPLCAPCHAYAHLKTERPKDAALGRDEEWLLDEYGIDVRGLCKNLWSIWNNKSVEGRDALALRAIERARR